MAEGEEKRLAERRADLLRQAAAAAKAQEAQERPGVQLLLFTLGGESYAFPLDRVREVAKPGPITPVPSVPGHILGVMNLRGEILPILDPKRLLGVGAGAPTHEGRIIVVQAPGMSVGFLADGVADAVEVKGSMESPLATLPERQARYLQGQVSHEGLLVGVLDVDTLLERQS